MPRLVSFSRGARHGVIARGRFFCFPFSDGGSKASFPVELDPVVFHPTKSIPWRKGVISE
eukprot:6898254-Prorocentrum_lima.AAC.1